MRDPRYDILFEPVKIGPVTAHNRFYQVPHCNGMGHAYPKAEAAMRGMKAQGGWAVVSTQEVEIHPGSEWSPYIEGRLWDEGDMKRLRMTADAIHEHGALAAIEITHNGHASANHYSRLPAMGVSEMMIDSYHPAQAYAMSKRDIADVRRWHRKAALRSKQMGFDIVYVYAAHDLALPFHFISPQRNQRTDEYGGSLENRVRFLRELLEDTKDAVGDTCGIALRFTVDQLIGARGMVAENEGREVVEMLAEHPDIWDVNISDWSNDSATSRFAEQGFQEKYTAFVNKLTTKPVVGVGRFTSPDAMVSQIKRGILDMIGAARPSIADPFLPSKIESGQVEDIRECIGCNICVSGDMIIAPIRCTQNPTMGEEFRRGWHPEKIEKGASSDAILIVGAGPSGLESAMSLGRRGYNVTVAEANDHAGGRVHCESQLPGLSAWRRVVDYRLGQIDKLDNVQVFLHSEINKQQVLEFAKQLNIQHVVVATGSKWDRDGIGRVHRQPIPRDKSVHILTPDDVMAGKQISGHVVVYDDDHYYMGGVIAECLVNAGAKVTLVTPAADVSAWTHNTLEQIHIEKRLGDLGIAIVEKHQVQRVNSNQIILEHIVSAKNQTINAQYLVLVTARRPLSSLYFDLDNDAESLDHAGIKSVTRIGDCLAPSTIAAAVYHGHRFAREFDCDVDADAVPFKREYVEI
ncbi:FAD-dependent oxidoreductase [Candidatus Spongiihabitans sp.]|uniref:oxidoreductase n=1 Tax=Candidatus Spongiihabitans sp. TaxID=3101308 RepID=UPI003C7A1497